MANGLKVASLSVVTVVIRSVHFPPIRKECHYWHFVENTNVDLFRVENGKLERFFCMNDVTVVEEV